MDGGGLMEVTMEVPVGQGQDLNKGMAAPKKAGAIAPAFLSLLCSVKPGTSFAQPMVIGQVFIQ
ncbi:Uncharacterised protein [Pseudomonas luteola]|uniref:Uncharacterized protein n=3 Tax=Pseudomonas TaxID=286 RepID=A0A2X2CVP2_PSELU|nr:hypothetical protein SAMN05216295_11410 [Pseudomonas zeshuii]SPZ09696.1 Uncharacterised protein [Pseudomonas luteola]